MQFPSFATRGLLPFAVLFGIHVTQRLFECLFVHKYSPRRLTIFLHISGLSYYVFAPLSQTADMLWKCSSETLTLHGHSYSEYQCLTCDTTSESSLPCPFPDTTISYWSFLSLLLFTVGSITQVWGHWKLATVKPAFSAKMPNTKYGVPRGGLFEYIACPHYFGESLVYLGLLLSCQYIGLSLLVHVSFVWLNQIMSAKNTHLWYVQTFPSEMLPKNRKAIIPFLL